jgi:hypothetical protein
MNNRNSHNASYTILKPARDDKLVFVDITNNDDVNAIRSNYKNQDLLVSACLYAAPDLSAPRIYPLYFRIVSSVPEKTRVSTIEAVFYLADNFQISQDQAETIYYGGGTAYNGENDNNISSLNIRDTGSKNAGDNNDNKYLNASRVSSLTINSHAASTT